MPLLIEWSTDDIYKQCSELKPFVEWNRRNQ